MARVIETVTEYATKSPCRSAAQMEEICCEPASELKCCKEVEPQWDGHTVEEILEHLGIVLDENGRDAAGNLIHIEMAPRTKPCGEKVTEYDFSPTNCCDEIEPLSVNDTATPDILPAGGSIMVYFSGGQHPYEVKTSNGNTSINDGGRSLVTNNPFVHLKADDEFCGATAVTCSDGCTTVSTVVRSDLGSWYEIGDQCPTYFGSVSPTEISPNFYEAIQGKYKLQENLKTNFWEAPGAYCTNDVLISGPDGCLNPPCSAAYCTFIEGHKPAGAIQATCMQYDTYSVVNDQVIEFYCTYGDGTIAGANVTGLSSFGPCTYQGSVHEGSTTLRGGWWLETASLTLFEWRC